MAFATEKAEAADALRSEFPGIWGALSEQQHALLVLDLVALRDEEGGDQELSLYDAARILSKRIGGWKNLESYAETLEAEAQVLATGRRRAPSPGTVTAHDVELVKETARRFGQKVGGKEARTIARLLKGRH